MCVLFPVPHELQLIDYLLLDFNNSSIVELAMICSLRAYSCTAFVKMLVFEPTKIAFFNRLHFEMIKELYHNFGVGRPYQHKELINVWFNPVLKILVFITKHYRHGKIKIRVKYMPLICKEYCYILLCPQR